MSRRNLLKQKLASGAMTVGLWVTLEAPSVTEIAAELGYDWVVIDTEHGCLDFQEVQNHLRALSRSHTTGLVRIQEVEQGLIKRMLDLGADGIVVPQVTGPREVEEAVRFVKYPPWGIRGVGGERATRWGLQMREYTAAANAETLVIPLIETVAAGEALDAILDVPGVDAIYLGPADYSASAGHLGAWEGPGVAERLLAIRERAHVRGFACGVLTTGLADARMRREQGFRMLGLGSDVGLLIRASQEAMRAVREG